MEDLAHQSSISSKRVVVPDGSTPHKPKEKKAKRTPLRPEPTPSPKKDTAQKYSLEELNYFRVCKVTTRIIADRLREVFKRFWDTKYQATHGQWADNAKNGTDMYNMESSRSKKRNKVELGIMRNGNRLEWDCSCLFFAILYSNSIGSGLDPVVRKNVDDLRQFRNKVFAHVCDGELTDLDFQTSIQTVIAAFGALKLDASAIEEIKNQTTFPTEELRLTQQQLEMEKMRNEEPRSFCVLPPKPSHEVIDRTSERTQILDEMKRLRSTKPNEITVVYLSGNPGCGKSEIARQIGENIFHDDVPDNVTDQVKFVFALNASSTDTLIQSFLEFAISLNCDENYTTSIGTSKDLSQEDKLNHLKCLVVPKLRKYSSWLMIVDNVTDIKSDFKYLPLAGEKMEGNGQILVTTQDSQSIGTNYSYTYHLPLSRGMKPDEAITTLSKISGIVSDKDCILQVAKTLDFQPLALACAATYMKRVSHAKTSITWEEYLQKLEQGKREATEKEYQNISITYTKTMTSAVKLALEREISESIIMKHAFEFLSAMAPEPIPLEYVVQYVTQCLRDQDEDLVATTVLSSSLILSSDDQSKEIGVHQVVYSCLQCYVPNGSIERQMQFLENVISAFSTLLNTFDMDNLNHIIETKSVAVHLVHFSKKLAKNDLSPEVLKKHFRKEPEKFISYLKAAGQVCQTHAMNEAAITFYDLILIINEDHSTEAISHILSDLGNSFHDMGKYEEAHQRFEEALAIQKNVYDENHPELATTLNNLGNNLRYLFEDEEAQRHFQRALAILKKSHDENHPTLAITYCNLGKSFGDLDNHEEAHKCFEKALAIQEAAYGKNHPKLAMTVGNLGYSLRNLEKHEQARECSKRAKNLLEMAYDQNHPNLGYILITLGKSSRDLEKHEEALQYFKRALAIRQKTYGPNHSNLAITLCDVAISLDDLGKHVEAKENFKSALVILEEAHDKYYLRFLFRRIILRNFYNDLVKHENGRKFLKRALAIAEKKCNETSQYLVNAFRNMKERLRKHEERGEKCILL